MIVLDTDHISVLQDARAPEHAKLTAKLSASADRDIVTTAVTLEEQMRGWLAYMNRSRDVAKHVVPYERLIELVQFFSRWTVLPFDDRSADQFKQLRAQKVRIGSLDLKIASIALLQNARLLSANLSDFRQVPNLQVEDWLH